MTDYQLHAIPGFDDGRPETATSLAVACECASRCDLEPTDFRSLVATLFERNTAEPFASWREFALEVDAAVEQLGIDPEQLERFEALYAARMRERGTL